MKPISALAEKQLFDLYYKQHNYFGRDKLYKLCVSKKIDISRRQVLDWLNKQEIHQLHAPTFLSTNIQHTILKKPGKQIGIDLIDMQNYVNDGYHYILTGIDLFSKKAYARPLKNKTGKATAQAMQNIIKKDIKSVSSIRSDNGSEFISEEFKSMLAKNKIRQVLSLPGKPQSNGNIERFNSTLKRLLRMAMRSTQSNDWPNLLKVIIENYNNTEARVTGQVPNKLDKSEDKGILSEVKNNISKSVLSKRDKDIVKFKPGDKVRIKLDEDDRERSGETFSKQIYTVDKIQRPKSTVSSAAYVLKLQGKVIKQKFYNNDLLLIPVVHNSIDEPEKYEVSKIVRPVTHNKKPAYLIKWLNYPNSENTIEPRDQLLDDIPKLVEQYEKKHNVKFHKDGKFTYEE